MCCFTCDSTLFPGTRFVCTLRFEMATVLIFTLVLSFSASALIHFVHAKAHDARLRLLRSEVCLDQVFPTTRTVPRLWRENARRPNFVADKVEQITQLLRVHFLAFQRRRRRGRDGFSSARLAPTCLVRAVNLRSRRRDVSIIAAHLLSPNLCLFVVHVREGIGR